MLLTLTVMIGLFVQDVLGYSALRAGVSFIAVRGWRSGLGSVLAARTAPLIAPRWLIIGCADCSCLQRDAVRLYAGPRTIPYFPDLVVPIVVGGFGIGVISVDPAALRGGRGRAAGDRPGVGDHADGAATSADRWCWW